MLVGFEVARDLVKSFTVVMGGIALMPLLVHLSMSAINSDSVCVFPTSP